MNKLPAENGSVERDTECDGKHGDEKKSVANKKHHAVLLQVYSNLSFLCE